MKVRLKMSDLNFTRDFLNKILAKRSSITDEMIHDAKRGFTDYLASSLAAKNQPRIQQLINYYEQGGCKIIGYDDSLAPMNAVTVNAYIAHYMDLDDVHSDVRGHPSAVILPALLALNDDSITALHFFEAYIVGIETMAVIGRNIGSAHYEQGWHATATLGSIASAVAVSCLLGLSVDKIENAVGIAVSQSSGLRSQFGSDVKSFQLAKASADGFEAAQLSQKLIIESSDNQLRAFFNMYSDTVVNHLAVPDNWAVSEPGLWFKKYPCCSANFHAIDALTAIISKIGISSNGDHVQSVELIFPPGGDAALIHKYPKTAKEGMFSAEYVTALLLTGKSLVYTNFQDEPIDENTIKIMKKVTRTYDKSIKSSNSSLPKGRFTIAKVVTSENVTYTERIDAPAGSPNNPFSDRELINKLQSYLSEEHDADEILTSIYQAPNLIDIKKIIGVIR